MTETRPLVATDLPQMLALAQDAFGDFPAGYVPPVPADHPAPGRHDWGTFDGDVLAAKVVRREYDSWFHGRRVATNGIAGVAVAAEHRGRGLLDDLFAAVLDEGMRERGEVVSTLFPTAPGIYRRYGYELVSSYDTVEIPTSRLLAVPKPASTTLRRATAADVGEIRRVHETWARAQNGPLTRDGASFTADADAFLASFSGVSIAEEDGEVVGYAAWQRGRGYDTTATFEIEDLVALTRDATLALWRLAASYATVTGHVRLLTSGRDTARLVLPFDTWTVVQSHPYMLRVHDVAGAFAGLPLDTQITFSVAGDLLGTTNGDWTLTPVDGLATVSPGGPGGPVLAPRGVALLYAGAASTTDLRMAGLLSGDAGQDRALDTLLDGRQLHIRDYF
ncbi:GNAT family N-acetyltransferase [Nocardioides currus]|nr:GNAT family N-acetyltransferase [Nocardioides currus]